ncbi:hypothetical protein DCAR_0310462 [Daucus carota subsp. sativus]|uniref:Uncharacterized protein n=1 Tax=Daucus carota subsp. sativus TaxID=79200 RepID=A0A165ZVY7_DAUCS|nr:PREDICTED: uncharacterized protein LOC108214706 [Daucus carota subsp. sativus]WOG91214.1 hypothetical protein DCAR_0310462 [Daucus carota subsp. sativus]
MEICPNSAKSASEGVKNFHQLAAELSQLTFGSTRELSASDLGNKLFESLNLRDDQKFSSGIMEVCDKNGLGKEDSHAGPFLLANLASEKSLSKSASFPCSANVSLPTASVGKEIDEKTGGGQDKLSSVKGCNDDSSSYLRSQSLPTPSKLLPALKGSREKHGVPLKKLNVTWAPDVYDPIPTSVSHVVTNKSPRHRNDSKKGKKNSKNKQKAGGKSSLGSKGKDKKQSRKHSGNSNRCFKPLDDNVRLADKVDHHAGMVDFENASSPDPYCGTSFLKNNVTNLHFSVAEAT